jgi:predicted 3-demethylubiquinone-9 3-methyltransferase (glyoxalase superfamily)
LYVACATEEEIDRLFEKLSQGGAVAMPLASYPFSDKFAWVTDKYGVSWQLNLERN